MDLVSAPERSPGSARWSGELCSKPSHVGPSAASAHRAAATGCEARLVGLQCRVSCVFPVVPSSCHILELAPADSYFVIMRSSPQRRFFICSALCAHPAFYLRRLLCRHPRSSFDLRGHVVGRGSDETVSRSCGDSVYS